MQRPELTRINPYLVSTQYLIFSAYFIFQDTLPKYNQKSFSLKLNFCYTKFNIN